jgi:hypothetical protein
MGAQFAQTPFNLQSLTGLILLKPVDMKMIVHERLDTAAVK